MVAEAGEIGGVAQLVEHLLCKQGVRGSTPLFSTGGGFICQKFQAFPNKECKEKVEREKKFFACRVDRGYRRH